MNKTNNHNHILINLKDIINTNKTLNLNRYFENITKKIINDKLRNFKISNI